MRTLGIGLIVVGVLSAILGLSYTLLGMIRAFADANAGPKLGSAETLANHIAGALSATAIGLVVCIVLTVAGFFMLRSSRSVT